MSSVSRDMIDDHERYARRIQDFMWEDRPFKSKKREHTTEEYDKFLEGLRTDLWDSYNSGAEYMGWKE
jgi:hypothetical protein